MTRLIEYKMYFRDNKFELVDSKVDLNSKDRHYEAIGLPLKKSNLFYYKKWFILPQASLLSKKIRKIRFARFWKTDVIYLGFHLGISSNYVPTWYITYVKYYRNIGFPVLPTYWLCFILDVMSNKDNDIMTSWITKITILWRL